MSTSDLKSNFRLMIIAVLLSLTAVIYFPILSHSFISFDDAANIQTNPHILAGLKLSSIRWAFTHFFDGNWIPLNWISHMAAIQFFGLNTGGHFVINLTLHLLNTFLLFTFLERLTGKFWPSIFTAALFALHPLHVESVAWISERKDVLSGFFFMMSLHAYADYAETKKKSSYYKCLILFAYGLMSKPMLVTLPMILLLLDFWSLQRHCEEPKETKQSRLLHFVRNDILEKIPFFLMSALSSLLTVLAHSAKGWINGEASVPIEIRIANGALSAVKYLKKMVWPFDLAIFYPYDPAQQILIAGACSVVLIGLITWAVTQYRKRFPYLFFGWMWYLVMLLPVLGIVSFAGFSMADRFTYLPLIGIFIALGWAGSELGERVEKSRRLIRRLGFIAVSASAFICSVQIQYWQNTETVFKHALSVTRCNFIAHENLAEFYLEKNDLTRATLHYTKSSQIRPNASTFNNLGNVYLLRNNWEKAEECYRRSVELDPAKPLSWSNLGLVYLKLKKFKEAGGFYVKALQMDPKFLPAHIGMATSLIEQDRLKEADAFLKRALTIFPQNRELSKLLSQLTPKN